MFDFFKNKKDLNDENKKDESKNINIDFEEENVNKENIESENIFNKLKKGLTKTRDDFREKMGILFTPNIKIDDNLYEELEEMLIMADIGMKSTIEIIESLKTKIKEDSIKNPEEVYPALKKVMVEKLNNFKDENKKNINTDKPTVVLVIGVNGVGKTTTIGKIANILVNKKNKVMLAAADTFRAAAIEQLQIWSKRANVELVSKGQGSDPSSVIYDAINKAKEKKIDVLLCDTAGRLHNKKNLMMELEKIDKTISKNWPNANRENLLILDATTGQNAINQLKEFKKVTDITGLVLTKLDGTSKGGIIFPLQNELNVPVKYIGIGEGINDLQEFNCEDFVEAIF